MGSYHDTKAAIAGLDLPATINGFISCGLTYNGCVEPVLRFTTPEVDTTIEASMELQYDDERCIVLSVFKALRNAYGPIATRRTFCGIRVAVAALLYRLTCVHILHTIEMHGAIVVVGIAEGAYGDPLAWRDCSDPATVGDADITLVGFLRNRIQLRFNGFITDGCPIIPVKCGVDFRAAKQMACTVSFTDKDFRQIHLATDGSDAVAKLQAAARELAATEQRHWAAVIDAIPYDYSLDIMSPGTGRKLE